MAYSKLHSSIVNSSLWCEPDHIRLLFITLLAMCDKDGYVYGSRMGLERQAMIQWDPQEDQNPWEALMSPDPDSSDKIRAPENEGRRIEEVAGGFRLLNFEYYRGLRNDDDRREQNRIAQARFKAKQKAKPQSATVSHGKPPKAHTEAEADTDAKTDVPPKPPKGGGESRLPTTEQSKRIAKIFHRKVTTPWLPKEIRAYKKLGTIPEEDMLAVEQYYAAHWPPDRDSNILRHDLLTFLNNFWGEVDRARNQPQTGKVPARPDRFEDPMEKMVQEALKSAENGKHP